MYIYSEMIFWLPTLLITFLALSSWEQTENSSPLALLNSSCVWVFCWDELFPRAEVTDRSLVCMVEKDSCLFCFLKNWNLLWMSKWNILCYTTGINYIFFLGQSKRFVKLIYVWDSLTVRVWCILMSTQWHWKGILPQFCVGTNLQIFSS